MELVSYTIRDYGYGYSLIPLWPYEIERSVPIYVVTKRAT